MASVTRSLTREEEEAYPHQVSEAQEFLEAGLFLHQLEELQSLAMSGLKSRPASYTLSGVPYRGVLAF